MIKIFEKFNEPEIKVDYWDNDQKKSEFWYLNNKYHREDGPSNQKWYYDGQKQIESWWLNGKRHREDAPAIQSWHTNGQKQYEYWYLNHKCHREDGTAYESWNRNGQKRYEYWFLNDNDYLREDWINELKKIGSPHYQEQRMLLDMEKYNL